MRLTLRWVSQLKVGTAKGAFLLQTAIPWHVDAIDAVLLHV